MQDDVTSEAAPGAPGDEGNRRASELVEGARRGDAASMNDLISVIYPELKRRAFWLMTRERAGHTFGPSGSELVQRVMEKMLANGGLVFQSAKTEEDLINVLTRQMRFVLVDYARAHSGPTRPNPKARVSFESFQRSEPASGVNIEEVLSTDEVLTKLALEDPIPAQAFELRFFAGLTNEEAAAAMGLSVASFRRYLKRANAFLRAVMGESRKRDSPPGSG